MSKRNFNKEEASENKSQNCEKENRKNGKARNQVKRNSRNDNKNRYDGRSSRKDFTEKAVRREVTNNPEWYAKHPILLETTCSIPFGFPNGIDLHITDTVAGQDRQAINTIGGIYVQDIIPTPGWSTIEGTTKAEPLNVCARDIYAYIRHANSGHANYDAADLLMYMLAMDELFVWYTNIQRVYGIMNMFSPVNRFIAKSLVENLGFNYDDLLTKMPQLNYYLNVTAARINAFAVPNVFPLYQRHSYLFSGIYSDTDSQKAQLYAMKPVGYRVYTTKWENENNPAWGFLNWKWFDDVDKAKGMYSLGFEDIRRITEDMLTHLMADEDIGIISGDIIKAYGENLFIVSGTAMDFSVPVTADPGILTQISNCTPIGPKEFNNQTVGTNVSISSLSITQNPSQEGNGKITFQPVYSYTAGTETDVIYGSRLLNMKLLGSSPSDVMYATRLMVIPSTNFEGGNFASFECSGTEIPLSGHVIYGDVKSGFFSSAVYYERELRVKPDGTFPDWGFFRVFGILNDFRFAPILYPYISYTADGAVKRVYSTNRDAELYAKIDKTMLQNIHDTAILSLYNVPQR